jgi:predicted DNA-binding ribbon-helix-helix protein
MVHMSQSSRRSVRTSVILSEGQYTRLNEVALKGDVSVAWVIRQAVQQFLDRAENEQIPLPIRLVRGGDEDV